MRRPAGQDDDDKWLIQLGDRGEKRCLGAGQVEESAAMRLAAEFSVFTDEGEDWIGFPCRLSASANPLLSALRAVGRPRA